MENNEVKMSNGAPTREQITAEIKRNIESAETTKQLNDFLERLHPSDCHAVIRDMFTIQTNRMITTTRHSENKEDMVEYQRFQDIKMRAKSSWDHDHTNATMLDVDRAVSKAYGISIRMIGVTNRTMEIGFDKLYAAINRIEEHLGLEKTSFEEAVIDDTTKSDDVQGSEENPGGTGDTSTEE